MHQRLLEKTRWPSPLDEGLGEANIINWWGALDRVDSRRARLIQHKTGYFEV